MRRRVFISVLGSAAIWPFAARAQKSDGVRRVGVIMGFAENDEVWQAYLSTFRQALQNLGWTEGRNIRFDYRFSGESEELMRRMAEEIVGLAPGVILASTNSVVSATLNVTRSAMVAASSMTLGPVAATSSGTFGNSRGSHCSREPVGRWPRTMLSEVRVPMRDS